MLIHTDYFRDIFNTVRQGIIILDENFRLMSANRSFFNIFKVDTENTIGSLLYDLGNGQWNIPALRALLEDILSKNTTVDNFEIDHNFESIGRKIMLLNACKLVEKEDDRLIILLAIEDITERKRLEDLLAESEERYRRIFETASDGILLLEKRAGHIVNANPASEKMLGYLEEELIGKNLYDIGVSLDMSNFPALMQALNRSGIVNYEDVPVKTRSGQYIATDIYMVDRAKLVQCNIRVITERKALQQQLQQAQKMEAIGLLAGGIAHDFNNILNVIIGYGSMVMAKLETGSLSKEYLHEALIAADRAANLTKRLLVFSRKEVVEVKPMDVNSAVINMEKMLSRIIGEDINLITDLMGTKAMVMADAGQIEQVLMNLTTNARDAMPDGGSLTISTELREIDAEFITAYEYGLPGTYAVISVIDTGTGIDKEKQNKIFDPFFTTKEVGKGTGLGLSMAYGIIRQHNGYIKVYSEPGKGTTFNIWLPVIDVSEEEKTEVEAAPSQQGGTETILVAEDDASLRKLTRTILEAFGYNIITAEDGEDAIIKFMENRDKIALVMLDMIMPKMNGKEAYDRIKKMRPDIKTLFSSGYTADRINKDIMLKEGFDFIIKPAAPSDLLKKIREVLDK